MREAVLLLAHGAPERLEDIPEYMRYVRGGRPTSEAIVNEVRERYREIGASLVFAAPFVPTIPGTDTYVSELR